MRLSERTLGRSSVPFQCFVQNPENGTLLNLLRAQSPHSLAKKLGKRATAAKTPQDWQRRELREYDDRSSFEVTPYSADSVLENQLNHLSLA